MRVQDSSWASTSNAYKLVVQQVELLENVYRRVAALAASTAPAPQ